MFKEFNETKPRKVLFSVFERGSRFDVIYKKFCFVEQSSIHYQNTLMNIRKNQTFSY
jgi:hypothetical protein